MMIVARNLVSWEPVLKAFRGEGWLSCWAASDTVPTAWRELPARCEKLGTDASSCLLAPVTLEVAACLRHSVSCKHSIFKLFLTLTHVSLAPPRLSHWSKAPVLFPSTNSLGNRPPPGWRWKVCRVLAVFLLLPSVPFPHLLPAHLHWHLWCQADSSWVRLS